MVQKVKFATSTVIDKQGRIIIPADLRKDLGVRCGDKVLMRVHDGELHVYTWQHAIESAQAEVRKYTGGRAGLVDDFLRERPAMWGEEDLD